jgi:putative ABC transport system permease protein
MNELFGLSTTTIMYVLTGLFAVSFLTVLAIGLGNRTMFRMGLRNIPRRGTQTALVVAGLTLSTLIVTAAFVTGDTINYSFEKGTYDLLQRSDIDIAINGEKALSDQGGMAIAGEQNYVDAATVSALEAHFANSQEIDGFLPFLYQQAAVSNETSGRAKPTVELAGFDAGHLSRFGGLTDIDGRPVDLNTLGSDEVLVSDMAAGQLGARKGDTLAIYIDGIANRFHVAGIVRDEIASGVTGLSFTGAPGGIAVPLARLQSITGHTGQVSAIRAVLHGDVRSSLVHSASARDAIAGFVDANPALFGVASGSGNSVKVVELKQDSLDDAALQASLFTTFFLVLGLFSMAAGIMLIFMLFVMLAAERREEMGMARAVGAQRRHLVQSFIAEGMAYSLLAGVVGAALGVAASLGMTMGVLKLTGGDHFSLVHAHFTAKSIVIGYTLGVVVTFITVVFASLKASHVNIVSAIRSLPEERRRERKRKTSWAWVAIAVPALVVPPVGLWFLLRKGFGFPWALILGPAGIVSGVLLMILGESVAALFPFALGISLLPLSAAAIARYFGAPNRATWTVVGVFLAAYWLIPPDLHDALFGEFDSNIEMFVLSGVMVVISFTLIIVFNARLLTALVSGSATGARANILPAGLAAVAAGFALVGVLGGNIGDGLGQLSYLVAGLVGIVAAAAFASVRFPQLSPALKMAIAYPLANRFRTGMTISMFSLIVFSLVVFSILVSNFSATLGGDSARGNIDVIATTSGADAAPDLAAALTEAHSPVASDITTVGRVTMGAASQQVRQAGHTGDGTNYPIRAADDTFLGASQPALDSRATGYDSDAAVLDAVRTQPNLALVDSYVTTQSTGNAFLVDGVNVTDHHFAPFKLDVRDAATGKAITVTVIGTLKSQVSTTYIDGVYVSERTYTAAFGTPKYQRLFVNIADGANARTVATGIESALGTSGVAAESVQKLLDDQSAENATFQRMFQAFMALGLFVGIAGLGVVAFRSVVERRQQIGMLRAIGYQRGTVALTFLLESSFVAIMGILSGVVGGAIIARNLLTSEAFTDGASVTFTIPWPEVIILVIGAYAFALLMTWWPSRGASNVPVADALRYE